MPEIYTPEVVRQSSRRKLAIWAGVVVASLACGAALFLKLYHPKPHLLPPSSLEGSVLKNDEDTQKQQPIADVQVVATSGTSTGEAKSNEMGFFHIVMRPGVPKGAAGHAQLPSSGLQAARFGRDLARRSLDCSPQSTSRGQSCDPHGTRRRTLLIS